MNARRVAIQLISTGGLYGAERVLLELATYLRDQGWESHVLALEGTGAGPLVERARQLGLEAEAFVPTGRLGLRPMMAKLSQFLRRCPRAILHTHGYKPDILLRAMGVPRHRVCLATCHNWISENLKMRALEVLDRRALRNFDHVVAVSTEVVNKLLVSGMDPTRVSRIANGIAIPHVPADARVSLRSEFGIPQGSRIVAQIGRLVRAKRNDRLLEAVAELRDATNVHVLLAGEGDQRVALEELAVDRGIASRVHFCGYRADVARILAGSDLLALTSDTEAMPIIVLEAMAMSCPILATAVGGVPEMLGEGRAGWLVPIGDVGALSRALQEMLDEPDVAGRRAATAHELFRRNYSVESMGAAYLGLYERSWAMRGWA